MKPDGAKGHSRDREAITILRVDADEQDRQIHAAIARRAFELFEKQGLGATEREDWRRAETALLRPLCLGRMDLNGSFWVSVNASNFQEGTIQIWVAPRHLTICGKPKPAKQAFEKIPPSSTPREEIIFRQVGLPVEVDPSQVTATIKGHFLEILMPKVQANTEEKVQSAAA